MFRPTTPSTLKWLPLLLAAMGCGAPMESGEEVGTGQEALYIDARGGGWQSASSRNGQACTYTSTETCYFSGFSHTFPTNARPTQRFVRDLITTWPSSLSVGQAHVQGTFKAGGDTHEFEDAPCNNDSCVDFYIVADANIASPNTLPIVNQLWTQFVRFHCRLFQELDERVLNLNGSLSAHTDQFGQMRICKQLEARVDTGSFMAWVNGWAFTTQAKQSALDSLYMHMYQIAAGAGASSSYDLSSVSHTIYQGNPNATAASVHLDPAAFCVAEAADITRFTTSPAKAVFSQTSVCN